MWNTVRPIFFPFVEFWIPLTIIQFSNRCSVPSTPPHRELIWESTGNYIQVRQNPISFSYNWQLYCLSIGMQGRLQRPVRSRIIMWQKEHLGSSRWHYNVCHGRAWTPCLRHWIRQRHQGVRLNFSYHSKSFESRGLTGSCLLEWRRFWITSCKTTRLDIRGRLDW